MDTGRYQELTILNFLIRKSKKWQGYLDERRQKTINNLREFKKDFIITEEGQSIIKDKLRETREQISFLKKKLKRMNEWASKCSDNQDWFFQWKIPELLVKIKKLENKLWRYKNMILVNGMRLIEDNKKFDIEKIKEVPIDSLLDTTPKYISSERNFYRCPLHEEKNASFVWYKNNNSWYCFGCGKGGDVIQLYQEIFNSTFIEACKYLSSL